MLLFRFDFMRNCRLKLRYKQAKMAEKTIADCIGFVYWCVWQFTAAGASGC